jgi:hypothetical protein
MAHWNFTTSGAAIAAAGIYANASLISYAGNYATILDTWSDQIEGSINMMTRKDWVGSPAGVQFSAALSEAAACLIGNKIVNYDLSGYSSRAEAQTILNVNDDRATKIIMDLKDLKLQEKMV